MPSGLLAPVGVVLSRGTTSCGGAATACDRAYLCSVSERTPSNPRTVRAVALLLFLGSIGRLASAQSLTAGTLSGLVQDSAGAPLFEVSVTATNRTSGISRAVFTPRTGVYTLQLLPAGDYDVLIERIGYRPLRVTGVPVRAGRAYRLTATLVDAPPPVTSVDEIHATGSAALDSRAAMSQWFEGLALARLPGEQRAFTDLLRVSSLTARDASAEGLPLEFGGQSLDGLPVAAARHPGLTLSQIGAVAIPLSSLDHAELVAGGSDVEWAGASGGGPILSGSSRRGTPRIEGHGFADWSGSSLSNSKYFDTGAAANSAFRGGFLVTGPVIRDTAAFVIGAEVQHLELPRPAAWVATPLDSSLVAIAQDSFATDLGPYTRADVRTLNIATVFGRFDWQVGDDHALMVRANFARVTADDPDLGGAPASLGASLEGKDFLTAGTLTSVFGPQIASEFRFGIESSEREMTRAGFAATGIVDGGLRFGADASLPGQFKRTTVRVGETAYFTQGPHLFKAGLGLAFASFDHRYGAGRGGEFWVAGPAEFESRTGVFTQAVGSIPAAQFSTTTLAAYVQDTWTVSPGFDLQVGVRYEWEQLPDGKVTVNAAWRDSTGIDNTRFERGNRRFAPRLGITWDVQDRHRWLVRAEIGVQRGSFDPGLIDEIITHDVGFNIRRGVGTLSSWPAAPDSVSAPVQGPTITLLGPRFAPPRSGRAALGISRAIRGGGALHLAGVYRHTDYLPRRHDVNRLPGAAGTDQYGRPLYGGLVQQGSLLAATPGSNRRFPSFDQVTALDPDGAADYYGFTVALEGSAGTNLDFLAAYTLSRTTDNWVRGLSPFPDSLAGADWTDGRSDLDVPHRAVIGASWRFPGRLRGLRFAALLRAQSGTPFTPGFRAGVDANGDGSGDNDPAFVDDLVPGADSVIAAWDCLASQVGGFVERNSCRDPGVQALDLRLSVGVARLAGYPAELVVDAINLLESDVGVRDHALYLVDRGAALATNPSTGVTTVPLVPNPNFGRILARQTTGRFFRVGLRFNY